MALQGFERLLRRLANRFGIDVHRYRPESSMSARLAAMLATNRVNLLLDVGANVGQFAQSMRGAGFEGRMISFEPLSSAHAALVASTRSDPLWEAAPRVAVGDEDGEVEIRIAGNSFSSSILTALELHFGAAPESACAGTERAPVARLDDLAGPYLRPDTVPFLKMDTQGYEDRVLDGATGILDSLVGVHLETSFLPLYEDQQLFDALIDRLQRAGFSIWGIWPGLHDPRTGRMLQVDVTVFR